MCFQLVNKCNEILNLLKEIWSFVLNIVINIWILNPKCNYILQYTLQENLWHRRRFRSASVFHHSSSATRHSLEIFTVLQVIQVPQGSTLFNIPNPPSRHTAMAYPIQSFSTKHLYLQLIFCFLNICPCSLRQLFMAACVWEHLLQANSTEQITKYQRVSSPSSNYNMQTFT